MTEHRVTCPLCEAMCGLRIETQGVPTLMRGRDRCTLLVHPEDAARLGLVDNELAEVTTSEGSVSVLTEVSGEMKPGVNSNLLNPAGLIDVRATPKSSTGCRAWFVRRVGGQLRRQQISL
ncbi:hypothetical protein BH09ACT8_BH09ACT8_61380 [soil metagenome]